MGARTRLDLTADVTHLIVGQVNTPKYEYTAKSRPDIKVLKASWLDAVRKAWLTGSKVDVEALDEEHRLPTFFNLKICVTGFDNRTPAPPLCYDDKTNKRCTVQMRNELGETIEANGAQYMRDLTKDATHLIAAVPQGKKYEFAGQWGVKIVALDWLKQSLRRQMVLNERLFHPLTPPEERGIGAVSEASPGAGKRKREQTSFSKEPNRRKLRRTTSSKLESQNDNIWADIGQGETSNAAAAGSNQWKDSSRRREIQREDSNAAARAQPTPKSAEPAPAPRKGVFSDEHIVIHGFDETRLNILKRHLEPGGATVYGWDAIEQHLDENQDMVVMVPFNADSNLLEQVDMRRAHRTPVVSEFWVEKCIVHNTKVPYDAPLAQPLDCPQSAEFFDLTICPTSFAGVDLSHFSKAMRHVGAQYDETLTQRTSVLVRGSAAQLKVDKLRFAVANGIPIVKSEWAWACIRKKRVEPFEPYLLNAAGRSQENPPSRPSSARPPSDPKGPAPPAQRSDSSKARPASQPLRDITPKANSQSRSQASNPPAPQDDGDGDESLEDAMKRQREQTSTDAAGGNDENESAAAAAGTGHSDAHEMEAPAADPKSETQASSAKQTELVKDAIATLQRQKKDASSASVEESFGKARKRQLGRAPSNPSSLGSRTHAASEPLPTQAAADDEDLGLPAMGKGLSGSVFRPSQTLTYENEQSAAAREQLMRRMGSRSSPGGADGRGMKRVESIGVATDARSGARKGTRRR